MFAGVALTWGAAWVGLTIATSHTCRRPKVSTAMLGVRDAHCASAAYMMDHASNCPRGIDELVSEKYLERSSAKDPWGSQLIMHCPTSSDSPGADILSAGPDKREGTPDDIKSWDLDPPVICGCEAPALDDSGTRFVACPPRP
jgi:hypothetical protein